MNESVLVRWMNIEPVIESELSEKEKNKYHILMHIQWNHICLDSIYGI